MKLLEPQTLIIILVVVLIIFGPKQLPKLGNMLGKSMKSIREGMNEMDEEVEATKEAVHKNADETKAQLKDAPVETTAAGLTADERDELERLRREMAEAKARKDAGTPEA